MKVFRRKLVRWLVFNHNGESASIVIDSADAAIIKSWLMYD